MYLSRVRIDLSGQKGLAIAADAYESHRFVYAAYLDTRAARPLYRLESGFEGVAVIAQSNIEPDWKRAIQMVGVRAADETKRIEKTIFHEGTRFRFRLVANAVKTIDDLRGRKDSQDKPKRVRVPLIRDEQLRAWIESQGEKSGFEIESTSTEKREPVMTRNGRGSSIHLAATSFEGILVVKDGNALWDAMARGFGHGKGFGLGLLSIAPIPQGR